MIEFLVRERDVAITAWQEKYPDRDVYEDRELEVTSTIDIRVEDQIRALTEELGRRRVRA